MRLFLYFIVLFCLLSSIHAKPLRLVTLESAPAEYIENNRPTGINIDIINEAFKRIGQSIKIEFVPWKRALYMVENGSADGIIDVSYSQKRAKYIHYPEEEIYTSIWHGFKKKSSKLTLDENFENAKDIKLGATRSFHYGGKIQKAIETNKFKYIDEVHNNELNIKKLVAGRLICF